MPTTLPIDLLASSDSGFSSTDNLTNDDTPTLAGFAGATLFGATVDFTSNLDGLLGSTTVGADGIWQITLPQLSQGNNVITATITAPDTSVTTESIALDIDTYAAISIDEPVGVINQAFTLSGTSVGVENGRVVTITLTDSNNDTVELDATVSAGVWQVDVSQGNFNALDLGAVSIDVSASDRAGNTAQANKVVDFDMLPTITVDQPVADNGVINGAFTLSGTVSGIPNNTLVTVILDGVSYRTVELTTWVSSGVWQVYVGEENFNGDKLLMGAVSIDVSAGGAETTVLSGISGIDLLTSSDSGIQPPYNGYNIDDITNDDTPTIKGYIGYSGSETVGVTVDLTSSLDGALGSTTVGVNGYWEITLPQLSEGDNEITAIITAQDSSVTTNTIELHIDTSAAITIDQPTFNEGVTIGVFTVSGTAVGVDDGQVVTVVLTDGDSKTVELTTTVLAEAWSVDVSQANFKALDLGLVTIDASVNDIAANMAQANSSVYFTGIDLLASSDLGVSNTDNLTSDDTPTIEGYAGLAAAGFSVDVSSDLDGALGSTIVGVDGHWQMTLPQLSQGNNWITATITAPDSSVTTETIKLGIDTYATITIDESTINNGAIDSDFSLAGTVAGVESGRAVTVTFSDQDGNVASHDANVSAGQWSMDVRIDQAWSGTDGGIPVIGLAGIKAGIVDITVSAIDKAGNVATDMSSMARAGINLPANSDTGISSTDNLTNETTPIIEGYTHADFIGGLVELSSSIDGVIGSTTVDANGFWQITSPELAQGYHTITATITAIDTSVITDTLALGVDSYAAMTLDAPAFVSEGLAFMGTVSGVEDGREVTLTFTDSNSNTEIVNTVIADSQWQILSNSIPLNSLEAGDITINAQVSDKAGNVATDSIIANVPLALLGDNLLASVQLANGDSAVLFDEATGFTVQHFDAVLNPSTAPVSLTALNVVGDFLFEATSTVTDHYSLYSQQNHKMWTFDGNGALLTESAAFLPSSYTPRNASLHATDDGFLIEQQRENASGGGSVGSPMSGTSNLDMLFFNPNGEQIDTEQISYTFGRSGGIFGGLYGTQIEGKELATLSNGNILAVMYIESRSGGVVSTAYEAFIYDIRGSRVDLVDSFEIEGIQPSSDFNITVDDSSFTLATANEAVTRVYLSFPSPESPTVNEVDTSNTRPWLSGYFDADNTQTLTVTVDGKTYTLGVDSNLFQHANNDNIWVLKPTGFYHLGEHDIEVVSSRSHAMRSVDQTTNELTISRDMFAPRVDGARQIYNNRPAMGGWFDEAATKNLTVEIDGTVYTLGVDAELYSNGPNHWVLNLSSLTAPLPDAVYDVVVTTTDANGVTLQDLSSAELTIGMLAPTVAERETTNFKPVLTGFYDSDFANGLSVTVNGTTYTLGVDSELSIHANNNDVWKLQLSQALAFGDNDIQVTATDTLGRDKADITTDEIHIYQTKSQAVNGDVLITHAGNDTITINDNSFTQINAGMGVDTLVLDGDGINLDFSNIQGIDVVDLNDAAATANTLTLTLNDVLTATDNGSLSVLGDAADTVNLASADNWAAQGTQIINGTTFDAYDSGSASLLIEQGITVQMV